MRLCSEVLAGAWLVAKVITSGAQQARQELFVVNVYDRVVDELCL